MRPPIAALPLALALALPALAQEPPRPTPAPPPRADGQEGQQQGRRGGGGPPWANPDWSNEAVGFLTRELDLDPGQQEKVKAILTDTMRDAWKQAAEGWDPTQGGMPDMAKMRTLFEDMRVTVAKKINEVLSPDQRREFEVLVDQFDRRASSFEQRRRAYETPSELFDPPPISRRILLDKAERSLFLGPEETAAVMPFVERAVDRRIALDEGRKTRRQDLQHALEGGAGEGEVRQRLDQIHEAEEFQRLELAAAQQALRDLLTLEQEVRLVAMGILD